MKKKIAIWLTACLAVLTAVLFVGCTDNNGTASKDGDIVATVNGEGIQRERYETYKEGLKLTQTGYTDREVLDKMIRREVLFQEIERLGITVSEGEVQAFNEERFAMLEDDPNAYQITKDYVDGLGITIEEYKERSLEISRESLLTTKYRERLLAVYKDSGEVISFEDYYQNRLDELEQSAKIEILL